MLASAHWYSSNSFLAVAGIAATLLVGGLGVWITYLVGTVRYKLFYSLPVCTSLLAAPSGAARKDIKVTRLGTELQDPYILIVRLLSRSRGDIPSTIFDQNRPIILDVGVPIVALLPSDDIKDPLPKFEYEGSMLKIGPDLIGKRQEMVFTILADGESAQLKGEAHLINGRVLEQPSSKQLRARARLMSIAFGIIAVAFYVPALITNGAVSYILISITVLIVVLAYRMQGFVEWRYR